jgi:hypothetical protein
MFVQRLQAAALVLGPVVFALSPIFWLDGHYGVSGGVFIALSMIPWVYGLLGEYDRLRARVPLWAGIWLLLLLIGMFGSIAFGLQGFFEASFGITDRSSLAALEHYPPQSLLVLWLPGPTFPLAVLVFAALLAWTRSSPLWVAVVLCLAAIGFPAARVLRIEWVAFAVDWLMVVPFCRLAWSAWHREAPARPT